MSNQDDLILLLDRLIFSFQGLAKCMEEVTKSMEETRDILLVHQDTEHYARMEEGEYYGD